LKASRGPRLLSLIEIRPEQPSDVRPVVLDETDTVLIRRDQSSQ
jgi:hypothetical protein